ncbi:MarR family winged helix-turn-helix transcriptional regulator [Actinomadura scrupuli]|uniref:MarR family winged helix-turn-helix transcriptional regulator n=1 Tax=Actinomadura scrupuli TaxID=559629 RepID=UPI003D98D5E3
MTPDTGRPDADERPLGLLLRLAHMRAAKSFSEALRPYGIESRHYGVMLSLGMGGTHTQRQLIDRIGSDKSSMVRMIDDLETRGLVVRGPAEGDRRAHAVVLTEAGRETLAATQRVAREVNDRLLDCLTPREQATLNSLLARFVDGGSHTG